MYICVYVHTVTDSSVIQKMIILAVIGIALCSFASVNGIEIRSSGTYSHSYYTVSL